ncbi:ankyrin repeat protein [Diplodia corticola]|uniref:Ankyrin repeat protein n=1 Tax=Diplodia corticola TaxID=236234 RepID=A0A1J9QW55_9PEZI|nr:ankyrin repeat protein [Diplodia corticola]OJD33222.1 ankyrin repeat protein [Diplodia corticola]
MLNPTFDSEPWPIASNIQPVSGFNAPPGFHPLPVGTIWQAIDCIERRNVTELRMVLNPDVANETIPSLTAYPGLARFHKLYGNPILHWAVETSSVEVVEALLDAGADINGRAQTYPHHTPLMTAVTSSAISMVEVLLARGASTEPKDANGHQALSIAVLCTQNPQIVELVLLATIHLPWCDRLPALDIALSRRKREYGGPNHAHSTCMARILLTADQTTPAHSKTFLEPWTEHPDWVSLINEDEKKSLVHLILWGLDLNQLCAPPQVHSGATVAHTLLFHCWKVDMPHFLAQNLASSRAIGGELLRTLAAGPHWKCFQGERNAEAMSAFIDHGVDPESQHEVFGYTPLHLWIRSLGKCSTRAKIENALPSLAVLLEAGANPNRKIERYPIEELMAQEWVHRFQGVAIKVLEMLLSHFPDEMNTKRPWQRPPYFPITKDFEKYELGGPEMLKFRELTAGRMPPTSSDLLLKVAYLISMKKFLAFQFSVSKDRRDYGKISSTLEQLAKFGVPFVNFPTDFVLDIVHLHALSCRQVPGPGDRLDASESNSCVSFTRADASPSPLFQAMDWHL